MLQNVSRPWKLKYNFFKRGHMPRTNHFFHKGSLKFAADLANCTLGAEHFPYSSSYCSAQGHTSFEWHSSLLETNFSNFLCENCACAFQAFTSFGSRMHRNKIKLTLHFIATTNFDAVFKWKLVAKCALASQFKVNCLLNFYLHIPLDKEIKIPSTIKCRKDTVSY